MVGLPGNGYVLDLMYMSLIWILQHVWLTERWFLYSLSLTIMTEHFGETSHLGVHPEKLTWNLKITQLKSKIIFQALLEFHVRFSAAHELEVLDISDFIAPGRSTSMGISCFFLVEILIYPVMMYFPTK